MLSLAAKASVGVVGVAGATAAVSWLGFGTEEVAAFCLGTVAVIVLNSLSPKSAFEGGGIGKNFRILGVTKPLTFVGLEIAGLASVESNLLLLPFTGAAINSPAFSLRL